MRNKLHAYTRNLFYAVLVSLLCTQAVQASIYVVQSPDGQTRFTNTFIDHNGYQIFIAEPNKVATKLKRDAIHGFSEQRQRTVSLVRYASQKYGVDPALITAIISVESGFNPDARSSKGALGLMQLMPATAQQYGVSNPKDPTENVIAGTRHFKMLLNRHKGNIALALAAYNAGNGPVSRNANRIPPYSETMLYVSKVLALYERYRIDITD